MGSNSEAFRGLDGDYEFCYLIGMVQWGAIELERESGVPLYRQLQARIAQLVAEGKLVAGDKLPASRELAAELGVNRNTVTSAYEELAARGLVRSHVGQGTFVSAETNVAAVAFRFSQAVSAAAAQVRPASPSLSDHANPVDFASLVPDEELFPIEPFREVLDDVLEKDGKNLLQYGPTAGYPPLREFIAERLRERDVAASSENVLIVNGSQQALDLVCRTLLDPGDRVALESPTYTIVLSLLAQYRAGVEPVPMTERGMDLEVLETLLERGVRPKLVFTMPTFHNPTGLTMDVETRERLVAVSARYGIPVVEDDFESDLRFEGEPIPPLKALDEHDAVVHIGTFSKGLFPGLRLGWIAAPRDVVEAIGRAKLISDYHTSLLLQAAVLEFCRRGHYDRHLENLVGIYRTKSRRLVAALARTLPAEVRWTLPQGGYAFWLTLPEGLSSEELLRECAEEGVLFTPGTYFFAHGDGRRYLRLSISRVPLERIDEGIARFGRVLGRKMRAGGGSKRVEDHEAALHI